MVMYTRIRFVLKKRKSKYNLGIHRWNYLFEIFRVRIPNWSHRRILFQNVKKFRGWLK